MISQWYPNDSPNDTPMMSYNQGNETIMKSLLKLLPDSNDFTQNKMKPTGNEWYEMF